MLAAMPSSAPIRLALAITELEPGGAERCLVEIALGLDRNRYAPAVYSLAPEPVGEKRELVERLQAAGIPTQFLDLQRSWQFFSGARRLASLLREQQAEIVQTFLFHANVLGARAERLAGVPHVTGLRVADPRRWRISVERWATRSAAQHVCVSQSVADFYRQRGFDAQKLVVIPNGIDVARWRDAPPAELSQFGIPPGQRAIIFVGRLHEQKGLAPLFAHLRSLFQKLPGHDLLLVGDGPQRSQLTALAQQLEIADLVHFAGWRSDVHAILAAADLLVLPSRWEGMPNAILEAMAAGKPVVAAPAHGVVELLGDAADEQVVSIESGELFHERIATILSDPKLAARLGTRNQERAIQQFSIGFSVSQYDRLYAQLARK
jgi:glycosyltransferase involved in cell wall biosynthesis